MRAFPLMSSLAAACLCTSAGRADVPAKPLAIPEGYELVWADEFDKEGLPDAGKWRYDTSRNRAGWYNSELQYYSRRRPANARVKDGRLVIEARRDDLAALRLKDWGGQVYSSARLTTRGRARWRDGFFEVRAKLPCVRGAWPAIWLLPDSHRGNWLGGEIDLAEAVGEPGIVHHAVHTRERNFRVGNHVQATSLLDYCGSFHDYQALWTDDLVLVGVDGQAALSAPATDFTRPMSLILNVAIGGDWAGVHGIDDAGLPARLEVEHVRVYQSSQ